jgi:acyl-CoA thioester hydrolase
MPLIHKSKLRVRYAETDQMGIAHHSATVLWLEVARLELLRDVGLRYRDLEREGVFTSVIDVKIRYRAPALYDEELTISCWLSEIKKLKLGFSYEIHDEAGKLLTLAYVCVGSLTKEGRPNPIPSMVHEKLGPYFNPQKHYF